MEPGPFRSTCLRCRLRTRPPGGADVFDLADRISVMLHGKLVGTVNKNDVSKDDVLGMIILGKKPEQLTRQELEELRS